MLRTDPPGVLGRHPLHQRRGDRAQVRLRQEVRARTGQLVPALRGDGETHVVGGDKVIQHYQSINYDHAIEVMNLDGDTSYGDS